MKNNILRIVCFVLLTNCFIINSATNSKNEIFKFIKNGGCLVTNEKNEIILKYNANKQFIPASILKIVSSYFLLEYLKPNFRFKTNFYFDTETLDLYIKGYGDPFFVSEYIHDAAIQLKKKLKIINNIYVDDSFFEKIEIPGVTTTLNPYDTQNGALTANFNTIDIKYKKNKYFSNESQTPLTNFAINYCKKINFKGNDRINIGHDSNLPEIYCGELLKKFLELKNIRILGKVKKKKVKQQHLILSYYNPNNLKNITKKLLKFSNNFMINQIFLFAGTKEFKEPANLKKSIKTLKKFFANRNDIILNEIYEASGISHRNKLSCMQMNKFLNLFKKYQHLLPKKYNGLFKTGTLTGVYSVAGFYKNKNNQNFNISIILNQNKNNRNIILKKIKKFLDEL